VPWPHYPNKNVFSDRRNRLYSKSASLKCDGKLFHSPGPAAAKALSPKVLWVRVTTHVEHSQCIAKRPFIKCRITKMSFDFWKELETGLNFDSVWHCPADSSIHHVCCMMVRWRQMGWSSKVGTRPSHLLCMADWPPSSRNGCHHHHPHHRSCDLNHQVGNLIWP